MSQKTKKEYSAIMAKRYKRASLKQKTTILDEYCQVTKQHRKYAIRQFNNFTFYTKRKSRSGRPKIYSESILEALRKIWLTANLPCGKRLKPILPLWLPSYQKTYGHLPMDTIKALTKISASTIDRLFEPIPPKHKKRGYSATRSGTLLRKQIPIKINQWDQSRHGFIESDTVHHCGESMADQYAVTVNYNDIAFGWTQQRAVWGKRLSSNQRC